MTSIVDALVINGPSAGFSRDTIVRRAVGPRDVSIRVEYCGICHSDVHAVHEDWGPARFPMVPGHEIAGVVTSIGEGVSSFAVGDRVGVGCFVDSCRECEQCKAGEEQYCVRGMVETFNGMTTDGDPTFGGYSRAIVVDERYVLRIPDALALDAAAPLLCAGITMYSPMAHWDIGPASRVAIVGMGGLGHLGVKLASAFGATVTVLSQTLSKESDGRAFGASNYVATTDPDAFASLANSFDLIVTTVSADQDIDALLGLLRKNGTLVFVGIPTNAQTFGVGSLLRGRRRLAGSSIGGIRETQEMLAFCASHGIVADIETIGVDAVDKAYERLVRGDVRYRFVIDLSTFDRAE